MSENDNERHPVEGADCELDATTDPVLRVLRAARPEPPSELLSAHSVPNRALLEEILMTTEEPTTQHPSISRRRRAVGTAIAAAVAAAATAVAVVAPFGDDADRSADALVSDAVTASKAAFADTGRATLSTRLTPGYADGAPSETTSEIEFAGDDVAVTITHDGGWIEHRLVDGELFSRQQIDSTAGGRTDGAAVEGWQRDTCHAADPTMWAPSVPDPNGFFALLDTDADFEVVGDEEIDGVETTHLTAMRPESVALEQLDIGFGNEPTLGESLVSIEVWIDGDDVTRRIDYEIATTPNDAHVELEVAEEQAASQEELEDLADEERAIEESTAGDGDITDRETIDDSGWTTVESITFSDLGDAVTVDAPGDYQDVCING